MKVNEFLLAKRSKKMFEDLIYFFMIVLCLFGFSVPMGILAASDYNQNWVRFCFSAFVLALNLFMIIFLSSVFYQQRKNKLSESNDEFLKKYEKYNVDNTVVHTNDWIFSETRSATFNIKQFDPESEHVLLEHSVAKCFVEVPISYLVKNYDSV